MKKWCLILGLLSSPAMAVSDVITDAAKPDYGLLQDAGGAISDVTKHAGAVISDTVKHAGEVTSETLHGMSQANYDNLNVLLGDAEDVVRSCGSFFDDPMAGMRHLAQVNAAKYHNVNPNGQRTDCMVVVAAACAYEGSEVGGALGAAIGAGGGAAAADWACSAWYP